jgi:hypothetical protein
MDVESIFLGNTLVMGSLDGEKTPGYVHQSRFSPETCVFKQTHFLYYILYIDQWGVHRIMIRTIGNDVPDRSSCEKEYNP